MKMTRNILRRIELKIYHAMIADQAKRNSATEAQTKTGSVKMNGDDSFAK